MTKSELDELQRKFRASGATLKSFLKAEGIAYTTYKYWKDRFDDEEDLLPLAPIEIRESATSSEMTPVFCGGDMPGVTLWLPSGIRAHFGAGSEKILMDALTKIISHVLPE